MAPAVTCRRLSGSSHGACALVRRGPAGRGRLLPSAGGGVPGRSAGREASGCFAAPAPVLCGWPRPCHCEGATLRWRRGKQTDACECPMAPAASVNSFVAYCNLEAFFRSVHLVGPVPAFWSFHILWRDLL
ncbi:hypothetical protein AV530_008179 [Patagioenas fasciata monilis]|uniref:Uncharacterized protein n=1 Tax=Patagioenas fasciata monilis TaxID=372326 RepID=A0A1V4KUT0_PATFA|nr:hypothetical protein AV530_008179 [Patagioenas fasciata monilis]